MSQLGRVRHAYAVADRIAGLHVPYVFGGSHGTIHFRDQAVWAKGVDCSSGASVILAAAGMLAIPRAAFAFDTEMFEHWGVPGEGRWLTLWVLDDTSTHHCVLEFKGDAAFEHQWWQATHTGGPVGWVDFEPAGFNARHWPAT